MSGHCNSNNNSSWHIYISKNYFMFPVNKDILVLRFELYSDLDFNCQRLYSKKISCIIYFFIHHFIKKILTAYGKHMINKFKLILKRL